MLMFVDTETGGLRPGKHSLLQAGFTVYDEGLREVINRLAMNVERKEYCVTSGAMKVNQIDLGQWKGTSPDLVVQGLIEFAIHYKIVNGGKKPILVGHNVDFDRRFLMALFDEWGEDFDEYFSYRTIDTAGILRFLKEAGIIPRDCPNGLHDAARYFGYEPKGEHTALGDIDTTIFLYEKLMNITQALLHYPTAEEDEHAS